MKKFYSIFLAAITATSLIVGCKGPDIDNPKPVDEPEIIEAGDLSFEDFDKVSASIVDLEDDITSLNFTDCECVYYGNILQTGTGCFMTTVGTKLFMQRLVLGFIRELRSLFHHFLQIQKTIQIGLGKSTHILISFSHH